jgi:hypothetical protein
MLNQKEMEQTFNRLKKYPNVLEKVKELVDTIERTDFQNVHTIEEALIPDVRGLGKMLLTSWASKQEEDLKSKLEEDKQRYHSKKNSIGTQHLEM